MSRRLTRPRKCAALGIPVVNPRPVCNWATAECMRFCYARGAVRRWRNTRNRVNGRFYMLEAIERDAAMWGLWTPENFRGMDRVRIASRFEPFNDRQDVETVRAWIVGCPETLFWVPTRAWRSPEMRHAIEYRIKTLPNARVQASIDASTTPAEWRMLRDWGWSTMGVWTRRDEPHPLATERTVVRCQKTWEGLHGVCATCEQGCFAPGRKDIHLRLHS